MTILLNCHQLSKGYGSRQLFTEIAFGIFKGDKIGLVGPNGAGKSTLLKILAGLDQPDAGHVSYRTSLRICYVPQFSDYPDQPLGQLILEEALMESSGKPEEKQIQVNTLLSKLGFKDFSQSAATLSGGWKKRLDLAKQLVHAPDLLLLDEPTNHLDLDGILWLEQFLLRESITFMVTSHDRYFLQNVTTRMIELNPFYPSGTFISEGNYAQFLEKREEFLNYQQKCERTLASKVRAEIEWLRQTPKARTTKAQARVQGAERMMQALTQVRGRLKRATARIDFEGAESGSRKLLAVKNLSKALSEKQLFAHLDFTFSPGTRLGIVGTNGSGKTTLLRILAGEIQPDSGTLKYAEGVKIVYFDQHRQKLNPQDTLRRALAPHSDTVTYRGQQIHVNSWGKRFLFPPERLDLPVKQLSGGERARIGIARLMLQPADILLLDEPTNDLDIPTLEALEENLQEFPGAIALITHDRALLDRIATSIIGLGIEGQAPILADYLQWEEYLAQQQKKAAHKEAQRPKEKPTSRPPTPAKLSYKQQRELEQLEQAIAVLETKLGALHAEMERAALEQRPQELQQICSQIDTGQKELEKLYTRLEGLTP